VNYSLIFVGPVRVTGKVKSSTVMNIFVSNISFRSTEEDIRAEFEKFGEVSSAKIITDRETGRSRGFGFVEMPNNAEATKAINELHNSNLGGRQLNVNEAKPKN
jgi:RNA recognition motif-containing protein